MVNGKIFVRVHAFILFRDRYMISEIGGEGPGKC